MCTVLLTSSLFAATFNAVRDLLSRLFIPTSPEGRKLALAIVEDTMTSEERITSENPPVDFSWLFQQCAMLNGPLIPSGPAPGLARVRRSIIIALRWEVLAGIFPCPKPDAKNTASTRKGNHPKASFMSNSPPRTTALFTNLFRPERVFPSPSSNSNLPS